MELSGEKIYRNRAGRVSDRPKRKQTVANAFRSEFGLTGN